MLTYSYLQSSCLFRYIKNYELQNPNYNQVLPHFKVASRVIQIQAHLGLAAFHIYLKGCGLNKSDCDFFNHYLWPLTRLVFNTVWILQFFLVPARDDGRTVRQLQLIPFNNICHKVTEKHVHIYSGYNKVEVMFHFLSHEVFVSHHSLIGGT